MDVNDLIEAYNQQDDCPFDFLETYMIPEPMTFGAAMELYVQFMHEVDGDNFYRHTDEEVIDLVTGEHQDYTR